MSDLWVPPQDPDPAAVPQEYPPVAQTPGDAVAARLAALGAQAREATASLFDQAGITIAKTLMTISRGLRVEGSLLVTGDLELPNGSIRAENLESPVWIDGAAAGLVYGSVGSSWATYTTLSFTLPEWATQAVVTGIGVVQAQDTITGGLAYLDARIALGLLSPSASYSDFITLPVTTGASVALSSGTPAHTARLTGAAGSVTAAVQLRASHPTAYTSTSVAIAATVMATR